MQFSIDLLRAITPLLTPLQHIHIFDRALGYLQATRKDRAHYSEMMAVASLLRSIVDPSRLAQVREVMPCRLSFSYLPTTQWVTVTQFQ